MPHLLRESAVGQLLNWASAGRILPYPEQRPGYQPPAKYLKRDITTADKEISRTPTERTAVDAEIAVKDDLEKGAVASKAPAEIEGYPYLVEWEENDPDNPLNWGGLKRYFVAFLICLLTFSIYIGSAIYTSSIPDLMATFGVSQVVATLGLTLFVFAYGIGPMIFSPMQEMPRFGRNSIYMITLLLFVVFQIPVIFAAPNFATILVFRFLAGFVGSPALATGGSSLLDIFPAEQASWALSFWTLGAVFGPIFGPIIGGFAAQANGWRWPIYELLWISGFSLLALAFLFPETMSSTILLRRAERLRKVTGNELIKTRCELDATAEVSLYTEIKVNCVRAFQLSFKPAVLFVNVYIELAYAIFYLWFEAFPIVFIEGYRFTQGAAGLPFLGFVVTGGITFVVYTLYNKYIFDPRTAQPDFQPEERLWIGFYGAFCIPISLFIFGWTAQSSTHWMGPIIGASLYFPGLYLAFQTCLTYLAMIYPPQLSASIFAGNNLFRSVVASVFPLFGAPFFHRLGLGGGNSLLAGLAILMIPAFYLIIAFGGRLRARHSHT